MDVAPWCKACEAIRKKEWLQNNPDKAKDYAKEHRIKNRPTVYSNNRARERNNRFKSNAKLAVSRAIKRGDLIRPEQCSVCHKKCKPEGHHADYSKQLEVMWLCKSCHAYEHSNLRKTLKDLGESNG